MGAVGAAASSAAPPPGAESPEATLHGVLAGPITGPLAVDINDELFVVAPPERVRSVVCDASLWRAWFPGVTLTPYDDRGPLGVRWRVSGELVGTAEVWLQAHGDGTIVHVYVRAQPSPGDRHRLAGPHVRSAERRARRRYVRPLKAALVRVKDELEGGRAPGTALVPLGERVRSATHERQGTRRPPPGLPSATTSEGAASDGRSDDLEHRDRG